MASETVKNTNRAGYIFGDYLLMLIAPCVLSVWYYGKAASVTILTCVLTSVICDIVASIIVRKQYFVADLSALCSGIMIALMMPAGVPVYVCIVACIFAVTVVKIPFGGGMRVPFVPAAAGFAFASVCFGDLLFTYSGGRDGMLTASVSSVLASGNSMKIDISSIIDILTGNIYGPMGTGCIIVFIGCAAFLFIRRRSALFTTGSFLLTVIAASLIAPRSSGSVLASPVLELASGSLMFAAIFLLTDYATIPRRTLNKIVYGVFCGIVTMVMRHTGAFEETICFAVVISNAFSPLLEMATDRLDIIITTSDKKREKKEEEVKTVEQ